MIDKRLTQLFQAHKKVSHNLPRERLIRETVENREAVVAKCGALATWTPPESTGRSPRDTVMVRRPESEAQIDWDSPNNLPIEASTFDMLLEDALKTLAGKKQLYAMDRVVGADSNWALPVKLVTDMAMIALFSETMFRPRPPDLDRSVFSKRPFTLLVCPCDKLDRERYKGRLRVVPETGKTTNLAVAMDFDRRIGVVFGSAYLGSVKKTIFTVMNYYLPAEGILPLHCSANEGEDGDIALMLGLSGTGKTTLSADPRRKLLGDDEHGWSDRGIANFEGGCYAKLIDLDPTREPEIFRAVFHEDKWERHGAMVENAMIYPNGVFDLCDPRFTPNSRGSYPLEYLSNIKSPPVGDHPRVILFLTADANGVLPPVARLGREEAMLWFLMGYTSKLAGTETGVVDPKTVFSRFFGEPFMPRNPDVYASMLGAKMKKHGTDVYLVNTGWSGGPYGVGKRMDILITRELVQAALSGKLRDVPYQSDPIFHLEVPERCPGVDEKLLQPKNTWADQKTFVERAKKLAAEFAAHFQKAYGKKNIQAAVREKCPGL